MLHVYYSSKRKGRQLALLRVCNNGLGSPHFYTAAYFGCIFVMQFIYGVEGLHKSTPLPKLLGGGGGEQSLLVILDPPLLAQAHCM